MKRVLLSCLVFCLIALAHQAVAQTNTESLADYKATVAQRIEAIAKYLEIQQKKGSDLKAALDRAQPDSFSQILREAITHDSTIAEKTFTTLSDRTATAKLSPTLKAVKKQAAVDSVADKVDSTADYITYLHNLSASVESAAPSQVAALVAASYVPSNVVVVLTPGAPARLPPRATEDLTRYILGGSTSVDYPAVAGILFPDPAGSGGLAIGCTGTLIAPNAVLTAAHCLDGDAPQGVFFQQAGEFEIVDKQIDTKDHADLAILFLKDDVTSIGYMPLNVSSAVKPGSSGEIVGYGWRSTPQQTASSDTVPALIPKAGIKVYAVTTTDQCQGDQAGKHYICWTYPTGPYVQYIGSTCFGDSGGPFAIQDSHGLWKLAGVTGGGSPGAQACHPGDHAYDIEVYAYRRWISDTLKARPPAGATPVVHPLNPWRNDSTNLYVVDASGRKFDATGTSWTKIFPVDSGEKTLVLAVNATSSGSKLALQATSSGGTAHCSKSVDDTVLSCDATAARGNWTLTVSGALGQDYQVVATEYRPY